MIRFLFFSLIVLPLVSTAQYTYVRDQSIEVKDINGNAISNPWAGGLNAAQYNTMDLNADGKEDLVLFDRMANKVVTFLNVENQYRYSPEFEKLFPTEVSNWMLLRDYNCDGKKDIFTADPLGMRVFTNTTNAGEPLRWQPFLFATATSKTHVLLTQGFSKINLQLQYDDLPAITDADGDGDLDIFNFRFVGGGTVEYHQNLSKENYGTCDSLDFKRVTQAWGDFTECQCGSFAFNGDGCNSGGRVKHAGGKSLAAFDANGDSKIDLVMSEAECTRLYLLPNEGTTNAPVINTSSVFPADNPVNFFIFPSAFYDDVDFDGIKDFIASPNIFNKEYIATNLRESNWFYKNTGTNTNPSFSFVQNNFLQDQMIDVGDQSVPAFADYEGDGDLDLFISRSTSSVLSSTIFVYENVGTKELPAFKLLTDDYFNLSASQLYNLKLQFADVNQDNTVDLLFTATGIQTGRTQLFYASNQSRAGLDFGGQSLQEINFNITSTENYYLTNVDADGKPDLLVGRNDGSIEFWKNQGEGGTPSFVLENNRFLGFESSVVRQNIAMSSADLNADGKADLVIGDQTGIVQIISDYKNQTSNEAVSEIIFNPTLNTYNEENLGGRIWPVVANLFNATKPAIVVGNILGGIQILRNDEGNSLPKNPVIEIYPNPKAKSETLHIKSDRPVLVQVISILGQQLNTPTQIEANEVYEYQLPSLSSGMYLLNFTSNGKSFAKRLVIY
jgi:hypothetical protein